MLGCTEDTFIQNQLNLYLEQFENAKSGIEVLTSGNFNAMAERLGMNFAEVAEALLFIKIVGGLGKRAGMLGEGETIASKATIAKEAASLKNMELKLLLEDIRAYNKLLSLEVTGVPGGVKMSFVEFREMMALERKMLAAEKIEGSGAGRVEGAGKTVDDIASGGTIKPIEVADQKMWQVGDHFNKHGRAMGYSSKAEYDAAAKEFARTMQDHPDSVIFEGTWNGRGQLNGRLQRAITYDNKTVIIDPKTGQVIDFYVGPTEKLSF